MQTSVGRFTSTSSEPCDQGRYRRQLCSRAARRRSPNGVFHRTKRAAVSKPYVHRSRGSDRRRGYAPEHCELEGASNGPNETVGGRSPLRPTVPQIGVPRPQRARCRRYANPQQVLWIRDPANGLTDPANVASRRHLNEHVLDAAVRIDPLCRSSPACFACRAPVRLSATISSSKA